MIGTFLDSLSLVAKIIKDEGNISLWPKKYPLQRGNHLYDSPMTNLENPFLHAKSLWKKVYTRVFSQDNDTTEKEQNSPVKSPQYGERHNENPEIPEVGLLQDECGEFTDRTGFGEVRRSQLYCLAQAQHGTTA